MDMKRLKYIEKIHNQAPPGTEWGVNAHQVSELIQTIKHQHTLMERYKEALEEIADFGSPESAAKHLQNIASKALEGGGG